MDNYKTDNVPKFAGSSILTIAVLVITLMAMQFVAAEKQGRIIGILRLMGMSESSYWLSWLLVFAVIAGLSAVIATVLGVISGLQVYHYTDFGIHWVALFLYITAMTSLALLFTSSVQRALLLNIIGFLLFFMAVISNGQS
jgi:hypothetical protein